MKVDEVIRIIGFSILGFLLMFLGQPLIYQKQIISIADISLDYWLKNNYVIGSWIVFIMSVLTTVLWYILAATAKVEYMRDTFRWKVIWWVLGFLPLLSICLALYFNNSDDARLSLAAFFTFDGLFLLFWLPTATSSPGLLKYIPPGALLIRRLIEL